MTERLAEWVIEVVESFGYAGVAFLVTVENLFPPIPSEIVLALAGFTASRGDASAIGMVIAATVGSVVGAWILYGVAAAIGPARLRSFLARHRRWFRVTDADLDRTEAWFDRWAGLAVLLGRCVPIVRSLISIPAGFRRMPVGRFTAYTALGSFVWNTIFVTAGYLLGEQWERAEQAADYFQYLVLIAFAVAGIAILVWWWRARDRAADEDGR